MAQQIGNWMTSFFYEEDLKSAYMNGILNAVIKPGIYNANMYLYTKTDSSAGSLGLYMTIKKGTTFVFSNKYTQNNVGKYERDLNNIGDWVIKCVAQDDIEVCLISILDNNEACRVILGDKAKKATPNFFITASLAYEDTPGTSHSPAPQFYCAVINEEEDPYFITYRQTLLYENIMQDGSRVPDGKTAYLILGSVQSTKTDISYTDGSFWEPNGADAWISDHIFTGRGLPDYRQNFLADKYVESPDFMITPSKDKLLIDINDLLADGVLYKTTCDWQSIYGIAGKSMPGVITPEVGCTLDTPIDFTGYEDQDVLVTDVIYLKTRDKYSEQNLYDIEKIFSDDTNYKSVLKVGRVTWLSPITGVMFSDIDPTSVVKIQDGSRQSNTVPLDLSVSNVSRLNAYIRNRNLFPMIINYLRLNNLVSPKETTSIFPIGIAFRRFNKDDRRSVDPGASTTTVNVTNMLSFFDLQNRVSKVNMINFDMNDIYTILPIID